MKYVDIPQKIRAKKFDKDITAVENSIKNILLTQINSVPGRPEFGSNINSFLFTVIDPLVSALLEEEIIFSLERWEPRVKVLKVLINEDLDYNRIIVTLAFSLIYDPVETVHEYIFKLDNKN